MLSRLNNLKDLAALLWELDGGQTLKVDDEEIGFDMEREGGDSRKFTVHPCGSACCIGGWVQLCNPETAELSIEEALLSICPPTVTKDEAAAVCWGLTRNIEDYYNVWLASAGQAAKVIELLDKTGEARWSEVLAVKE